MLTPTLDAFRSKAFAELAAALRQRTGRILERLRETIGELLPAADKLTLSELLDDLPAVLEEMASALELQGGAAVRAQWLQAGQHGAWRYHQSFNLSEALVEYSVLRMLALEELADALRRPLTVEEVSVLSAGLDAASRRAAEAFVADQSRELQHAVEGQSKYLSFLSHDLRGGLNGILLMLEALRRELRDTPPAQAILSDMDLLRRSILESVGMMDRFLHAERFRKGKVEVHPRAVDLAALMDDTVHQFAHQAKAKGLEIRVSPMGPASIVSDRELLAMVLQNLLSNAVKYTERGTIQIAGEALDGGGCRLRVADQGPGISGEKLATLFAPFTRGETHGQQGVGLGLSIARQAADLLGARLWAESEVGRGSTFFLELPAKIGEPENVKT